MTFEDWMRHRGLSASSIGKYASAIEGPLSAWATEAKLTAGPLTALRSESAFKQIALEIQRLPIFQQRNETGHHMYSSALAQFAKYLADGHSGDVEEDIDQILTDPGLDATERMNLVKARIGQGVFRQKVLSHWKACAVTGFKDTNLLVASHIKPWRSCNSLERLDQFNGLLLTPNLDKAFDAGMITFLPAGPIMLSPQLTEPERLGISADMRVTLDAKHQPFMDFHRDVVFRAH
jgi:putative restriction endonuclease